MKLLLAAFFLLIIAGCTQKTKHLHDAVSDDEYGVINLVLKRSLVNDVLFKQTMLNMDSMMPRFPPPAKKKPSIEQTREANIRKLHFDSLKKALSTEQLRLYVNDSLRKFPAEYVRPSPADKITSHDDDTLKMLKKIAPALDTITRSVRFDTARIKPVYNYKMVWFHRRSPRKKEEVSPGEVFISRPAFTRDHNGACIYIESYHGPLWADGKLIYLMKKRGVWVILRIVRLWIA